MGFYQVPNEKNETFFAHVVFYFKTTLLHAKFIQFSFVTIFQFEVLSYEQFECVIVLVGSLLIKVLSTH